MSFKFPLFNDWKKKKNRTWFLFICRIFSLSSRVFCMCVFVTKLALSYSKWLLIQIFKSNGMTHMGAVTVTVNTDCYSNKIYSAETWCYYYEKAGEFGNKATTIPVCLIEMWGRDLKLVLHIFIFCSMLNRGKKAENINKSMKGRHMKWYFDVIQKSNCNRLNY